MQNDDLTAGQARELAQPKRWTVRQLMDKLPDVDPWWMRDALPHFGGDRAELESRLIRRMEEQTQELPRVYMGLVLFFWATRWARRLSWMACAASSPKSAPWCWTSFGSSVSMIWATTVSPANCYDCRALKYCANTTPDGGLRRRVGALVLRIMRESVAAPDLAARIDTSANGWLDMDELLQTLILAQPEGADAVLQQLIETETETAPVSLRCQAVLGYFELTGHKPRGAERVARHMLQMPATSKSGNHLAQFIQHGLVAMDTLARAAAISGWAYPVTQAIKAWPRGPDDTLAVSGLIEALGRLARVGGDTRHLTETLYLLPRTDADNQAITAALRVGLDRTRQETDRPWAVQQSLHQLLVFGDLSVACEDGLDPWDAMWAHWLKKGWDLADVTRLLADAGVMDAVSAKPGEKVHDPQSQILGLLWKEGDQRIAYQSIRDNGFEPEHDKLFGQLTAIVRPPVELETLSQTWDHHWTEITAPLASAQLLPNGETQAIDGLAHGIPVYSTEGSSVMVCFVCQGQAHRFLAYPNATWMDVWGVLDAFNGFMAKIGRPERAFWLAAPWDDGDEWGLFICAHAERFAEANAKLRLPLRQRET